MKMNENEQEQASANGCKWTNACERTQMVVFVSVIWTDALSVTDKRMQSNIIKHECFVVGTNLPTSCWIAFVPVQGHLFRFVPVLSCSVDCPHLTNPCPSCAFVVFVPVQEPLFVFVCVRSCWVHCPHLTQLLPIMCVHSCSFLFEGTCSYFVFVCVHSCLVRCPDLMELLSVMCVRSCSFLFKGTYLFAFVCVRSCLIHGPHLTNSRPSGAFVCVCSQIFVKFGHSFPYTFSTFTNFNPRLTWAPPDFFPAVKRLQGTPF